MEQKATRENELNAILSDPSFWNERFDSDIPQEHKHLETLLRDWQSLSNTLFECIEFLSWEDVDLSYIATMLQDTQKRLSQYELDLKFNDPDDHQDAIVSIHAGSGGTESQYWVEIIYRAYLMYIEKKGWKAEELSRTSGTVSGIKKVIFSVEGSLAYGHLKAEKGTHRFCRVSPFDSSGKVHTSFLSVDVLPLYSDEEDPIELKESDLKIDTFKSGGPGGQHANKADSAVRITHIPTGIVVQCQSERSQHSNRATARKMLKAKLREIEKQNREKEAEQDYGSKGESAFGHQIRSYELHQGSYVKDHRTGFTHYQPDKVLDGDFDDLIESYLMQE